MENFVSQDAGEFSGTFPQFTIKDDLAPANECRGVNRLAGRDVRIEAAAGDAQLRPEKHADWWSIERRQRLANGATDELAGVAPGPEGRQRIRSKPGYQL